MVPVKILIVGCGRVGSRLAQELDRDGHDVTIVDSNPGSFSRFASRGVFDDDFRGSFVVGDGTEADLLRRAGIEDADCFIAVTQGDNRNIMAAQIAQAVFKVDNLVALQMAKKHFTVPLTIARVNNPANVEIFKALGLEEAISATEILLSAL